jgi:hypothetical protein
VCADAAPQAPAAPPPTGAPPERAAGALRMLVALGGTPAAWTIQTLMSYAISAYACYPQQQPLHAPLWDGMLMKLEWGITLACIALAVAAATVAWRWWRQVQRRRAQGGAMAERMCFLALSSVMVSCVFLVASLFTASAVLMMTPCSPWRS